MKKFFITGTDTGVGKTIASAVLMSVLQAHYWKPIQSGLADDIADQKCVQDLTGFSDEKFFSSRYLLQASLAPDQAAKLENIEIKLENLNLPETSHNLIVEGAGGVLVPVNSEMCIVDLIKKFNLPVIIVARGTLGTINHTLLTIESLRQRHIPIYGIIFNGELNPRNQAAIARIGQVKILFSIPAFKKITKKILHSWVSEYKQNILWGFYMTSSATWIARDHAAIWHPFTQHQTAPDPVVMKEGKGAYLIDDQGNAYLDLTSSWWVNLHGHAHPSIAHAIYTQALKLEHTLFAGSTHSPAILLAEKLLQLLPSGFSKIFYSDNGSSAVEVGLKMAYQYWHNQNQTQRTRFVAFERGYHGDTIGAMSLGKYSGFFKPFDELLFSVECFPYPATWLGDENIDEKEKNCLAKLSDYFQNYGDKTAALIIEPLVQGAGGMNMCRMEFLQALQKLAHQYGVLIIYDEVMTGFGRTGELFASLKSETTPDIICLAKGLTGGFLPLAVTACHERIYQAFLGENFTKAFAHGHSFTANPLGCAAALASLQLLEDPKTKQQMAMIERVHEQNLRKIEKSWPVEKPRFCGTIAAFDLKTAAGYGSKVSQAFRDRCVKKGFLIRPLGDVVYFLPPFCIEEQELQQAYETVIHEIHGVSA